MRTKTLAICLAMLTTTVWAQEDNPSDTIKGMIRGMYREVAQGDFDSAIGNRLMVGASGYLRDGLLREAPDRATIEMVVAQYNAAYNDGLRITLIPSHINVKGNDRGALATFLLEGTITADGETITVLDRASQLWLNVEGEWKLAHFHYSKLTLPRQNDDDDDDDGEDDDD